MQNNPLIKEKIISVLKNNFKLPNKFDECVDALYSRIDESDDESFIQKKMYDVLFFFYGGSHLKTPFHITIDNCAFPARIIAATIKNPDDFIIEYLDKINTFNSEISNLNLKSALLYDELKNTINKLREMCPHLQYVETREYNEDEYGCGHDGAYWRKCIVCCLKERGEIHNAWSHKPKSTFKIMIGKDITYSSEKKYEDYKLDDKGWL